MDLEIVHAKSNKPLVTIQDQVILLMVLMLVLMLDKSLATIQDQVVGININGTSKKEYAFFLAWRVHYWGAEENTRREEAQVQRYQQVS